MSNGVEFDGDNIQYTSMRHAKGVGSSGTTDSSISNQPKMIQWLIKKGIVKSPNVAQAILIAVVIINITVMFIVITFFL